MGTRQTTTCCSAVALIAILLAPIAATIRAQPATLPAAPLSLFPIRTAWTLALNNPLTVAPLYAGPQAFFALAGDQLAAYEIEHGRRQWIATVRPVMELAAGDGLLFAVEPGTITAIRAQDGRTAWQLPAIGEAAVPPVWDNGWLVLSTRAGEVLAFRAVDGHLVWRRDLGSRASARPSIAADRVDVPLMDGRIVALRVDTGAPMWEQRLGGPATGLFAADDQIYAGSTDNYLYALDAADGRIAWRWRTGADVVGHPVVDERDVYFVSLDNVLRALSRRSGVQRWVRPLPLRPTRGPIRIGDALIVSGVAPMLRAYRMKDGTAEADLPAAGELAGAPYAVEAPPGGLPQILVVTRDVAKGAVATLFERQFGPIPAPAPAGVFKPAALEP